MSRPKIRNAIDDAAKAPSPETVDEAVARLSALSDTEYEKVRKDEARSLKVRAHILDKMVGNKQQAEVPLQGTAFEPVDPEPWSKSVDVEKLIDDLVCLVLGNVVVTDHQGVAIALYVVQTYLMDIATHAPILGITSPEPGCGKSTLLAILTKLCFRAIPASNISGAALFRSIEKWHPTFLIDEADAFLKHNEEMRCLIDSGHSRDAAFVIRTVGDDHEPRSFSTWGAKVVAQIGRPAETIVDRSIQIAMRRRLPTEPVGDLRDVDLQVYDKLCRRCMRFAIDNKERLGKARPQMPPGMHNRVADNWNLLLAIADLAGREYADLARKAAVALADSKSTTSASQELLADLREIFKADDADAWGSNALVEELCKDLTKRWATHNHGAPLSVFQLAKLLEPYNIDPDRVRIGTHQIRGYHVADFADAFKRYLGKRPRP